MNMDELIKSYMPVDPPNISFPSKEVLLGILSEQEGELPNVGDKEFTLLYTVLQFVYKLGLRDFREFIVLGMSQQVEATLKMKEDGVIPPHMYAGVENLSRFTLDMAQAVNGLPLDLFFPDGTPPDAISVLTDEAKADLLAKINKLQDEQEAAKNSKDVKG